MKGGKEMFHCSESNCMKMMRGKYKIEQIQDVLYEGKSEIRDAC